MQEAGAEVAGGDVNKYMTQRQHKQKKIYTLYTYICDLEKSLVNVSTSM